MKIVVIGGSGLIGSKLVEKLAAQGHQAVPASPNSGVNTLTGEGLAEVSTITEHEAAQVERANASSEFVTRFKTITARTARSRGGLR